MVVVSDPVMLDECIPKLRCVSTDQDRLLRILPLERLEIGFEVLQGNGRSWLLEGL